MRFPALSALIAAFVFSAAVPAGAAVQKHLYMSPNNDAGVYSSVGFLGSTVAYPIVDGRPAATPDRTYPGHTQGPIAFDTDGRLFAAMANCRIAVFAPNSITLERKIEIEPPLACSGYAYTAITALAVDRSGNLFVSISVECCHSGSPVSRAPRVGHDASGYPSGGYPYNCTLAYGPNAQGHATPLALIDPGIFNDALATDGKGELYVHESYKEIDVIADPTTRPHHFRSIIPAGFDRATNPIVDEFGQLYVQVADCTDQFGCLPGIAVFDDSAKGKVAPKSHFELPLSESWSAIAINDAALYALTPGPTIEAFHKHTTGQTLPLFTSFLPPMPPFPGYLAVGP